MTIKIEIEAHPDRGDMRGQIDQAMTALGFRREAERVVLQTAKDYNDSAAPSPRFTPEEELPQAAQDAKVYTTPVEQTGTAHQMAAEVAAEEGARNAKRERGKPAPGRARRTKAEIAEDEAADAADAAGGETRRTFTVPEGHEAVLDSDGRATGETRPQISTGEERVGPQDDPETAALDAADEAAETAGTALPPIERLRAAVGAYRKKHGVPASVALFQAGGLVGKGMAELTDDEIEDAIVAIEGSDGVEVDDTAPAPAATRDDLMAAMMRYAAKFDKTQKPAEMVHTQGDIATIFTALFGDGVTKLSQVPADGYGKAVAAVDAAISANRFGR